MSLRNTIVASALLISSIFLGIPQVSKAYEAVESHYIDWFEPDGYICAEKDYIYPRKGPGNEYDHYNNNVKIPNRSPIWWWEMKKDSNGTTWFKITDGSNHGWVSKEYLCWF